MNATLIAREYLNAGLIPLTFCIMVIIVHSLYDTHSNLGKKAWKDIPGVGVAVALWWLFFTEFLRANLAWVFLHRQLVGYAITNNAPWVSYLYVISGVIASLATFRLIYKLSPFRWGHKAWIAAAILTGAFLIFIALGGADYFLDTPKGK